MCGINGIFAYHYAASAISQHELARVRDHMATRGPDGQGEWISSDMRVGFGHRRLSIIDLSDAGAQPMINGDGSLVVTFNGEIYNYKELKKQLIAKGYVFRSNSDTEVLLHLYADKGDAMVHDLRGMFAFAIWDHNRRRLFLARDPYGIKPLYYSDDGWTFRFASQVKALLASDAISRDPEPAGQVGFYLWGSVPEPFTLYRDIRCLPAGCTMMVGKLGPELPMRYHSIAREYRDADISSFPRDPESAFAVVRDALAESVRHHLVADVPVGAFLSAGIDSCALLGLMRDVGQRDIETVTLSFEEYSGRKDDEEPLAKKLAGYYGAKHTVRMVTRDEFTADLPLILDAMDQPSIDGINTWFVSKAARELGLKVAVSGLGGDELFGGYSSFSTIPKWVRWLSGPSRVPLLGRAARALASHMQLLVNSSPKAAGMLELGGSYAGAYLLRRGLFMPWELEGLMDRDTVANGLHRLQPLHAVKKAISEDPQLPFSRVAAMEASLYMRNQLLRDTDWTSMAHSLEVRVPLVDVTLLKTMAAATKSAIVRGGAHPKAILANAPSKPLPDYIADRAKTGFTTPIADWLQPRGEVGFPGIGSPLRNLKPHWSRRWAQQLAC